MRLRTIFVIVAVVATNAVLTAPVHADTGAGDWGSITVEPICINGESGRRISITAHPGNTFDVALNTTSADMAQYEITSLRTHYAPGETISYDLPVSEHDSDSWWLFAGWDGDAGYQATGTSPAGDCGGNGDDLIYPSNSDGPKGNSKGECKAVLVHVDNGGTPTLTVDLSDGSQVTGYGWQTGRVWHFKVNYDPRLTPQAVWADLNGSSPFDAHAPRLNIGRC